MREITILTTLLLTALLAGSCAGSVRPGINQRFLSPDLDVDWALGVFESESREIYVERQRIVEQLGLSPGSAVADVGTGTGLFLGPMARAVGPRGKVYAVDISGKLVEYVRQRVREAGLRQVEVLLSTPRSAELPPGSVELVFACDTYHHFEYPGAMLASLHRALKPGGRLVIVDFDRVPGVSRDWVLEHVRAGKEEVTREVEAAGFVLEEEVPVEGLRENYVLRFRKN
ncbi:MAG: methyltransferase domain-containing protein [Planctomycetota bacterium]|nr:methyltransferase domain-containing protein [Planctomycetota bacterium]